MVLTSAPVAPFHPSLRTQRGPALPPPPLSVAGPNNSEDPVHWTELMHGDRVHHRDYGPGTVHSAGPLWLLITWDTPNGYDHHWSDGLARHLTRLAPATLEVQAR